jgi:hypothetical protein
MRRFVLVLSAHPRLVAVQSLARQAASSPASGRKATSRAAKDGASTVLRLREKCTRQWLSPYQREPHITRGVDVGKRPVLRWLENGTSVSALWSSSSQRRSVSTRACRPLARGRRAPCLLLGVTCILHPAAATGGELAEARLPLQRQILIAYRNRSGAYTALGESERAEEDYRRALALNPEHAASSRHE